MLPLRLQSSLTFVCIPARRRSLQEMGDGTLITRKQPPTQDADLSEEPVVVTCAWVSRYFCGINRLDNRLSFVNDTRHNYVAYAIETQE